MQFHDSDTVSILTKARDKALQPNMLSFGKLVKYSEKAEGGYCYCALGLIAEAAGYQVVPDPRAYIPNDNSLRFSGIDSNYSQLERADAVGFLADALRKMKDTNDYGDNGDNVTTIFTANDIAYHNGELPYIIMAFNKAIQLAQDANENH